MTIGATIASWNRSTAIAVRPTGVASRRCSARSCDTIAVEDSANPRPRATATPGPAP